MRTTVTLDPDTEQLVRERMESEAVSFKQALNDAIRAGLGGGPAEPPYVMPVFDLGVPKADLTKALLLAGELEDEDVVRRMRRGT